MTKQWPNNRVNPVLLDQFTHFEIPLVGSARGIFDNQSYLPYSYLKSDLSNFPSVSLHRYGRE